MNATTSNGTAVVNIVNVTVELFTLVQKYVMALLLTYAGCLGLSYFQDRAQRNLCIFAYAAKRD